MFLFLPSHSYSEERELERIKSEVLGPYTHNARNAVSAALRAVGTQRAVRWPERNVKSKAKQLARKELEKINKGLSETAKEEIDFVLDQLESSPADYWLDEFMKAWVSRVQPSWTPSNLKMATMEMLR